VNFDAALQQVQQGKLLPLYLITGEERFLRDELLRALRKEALAGGLPDFNEDKFTAGEVDVERVLGAARTVPMMANKRLVLVRDIDRWDAASGSDESATASTSAGPLDRLAQYAAEPVPTTCVVLTASKLDGRRKLTALAKKQGFLVTCDALGTREQATWVLRRAEALGHTMGRDVAEFLAEIGGPELAYLQDALERLSLYVGPGQPITEESVSACVVRVRTADTWALVDAVGARDLAKALRLLADVYDPRDRGLPLLGAVAWSMRQLLRFQLALGRGCSVEEAAKAAGVFQPFRARELGQKAHGFRPKELERWLQIVAETDLALKSSRRAPDAILEDMISKLCRKG
jgi:DNA polymerase-3 subunit delta